MKRQMILSGIVCCSLVAMSGTGLWCGAAVGDDAVAVQPGEGVKQMTGRFVAMAPQKIGDQTVGGFVVAMVEGAGLRSVLVEPGDGAEKLLTTAMELKAGQLVNVTYKEVGDRLWASELKVVEQEASKAEGQGIADVGATDGPGVDTSKTPDKPVDEFADADSRARAKIRQLEQRVAELEAELRKLHEAANAKADSTNKEKTETQKLTGTTSGRVGSLTQRTVDGKAMPAVVVTVEGVPTVLVIPQIETDSGEKIYDPAVRTVVESLKPGQQVKAVWETDGKEKMIKSIEVVPETPTWPDMPRRRRG